MNTILQAAVVIAALLFIAVSATMNALFLSSLGRTPFESTLFATVSVAGDIAKTVLPVLILRAVLLRAWATCAAAGAMLAVVVALSLASGTGFTALTRGSVTAAREAQTNLLSTRKQDLLEAETRMVALSAARPVSVVEGELSATRVDRRWQWSKSCADINSMSIQKFCAEVFKLRTELATGNERDGLDVRRQELRASIQSLGQAGAGTESDPQASAIAALLGVDRSLPRLVLTTSIAVVLELGSIVLVLLAAGPTLRGWYEPGQQPKPVTVLAKMPEQADRNHWKRQRELAKLGVQSGGDRHAR